jgi:EPS-associated MarR family transcriptional regulator
MLIVIRHGGSVPEALFAKGSARRPPFFMSTLQEENHLKVMRLLVDNPRLSQRELADALGVSLGKTNYCLKALMDKGLIKVQNFRNNQNKLAYAYLLTPLGIAEKTKLTADFLRRKMAEYEGLNREIELLKREVLDQSSARPMNAKK